MIELAYLIPNAVPEITTHYCIGVLWTLPVQLQFTYVVLAAAVVIRDIRVPWKRFGIYALVILAGWYARVSAFHPSSGPSLTYLPELERLSLGGCSVVRSRGNIQLEKMAESSTHCTIRHPYRCFKSCCRSDAHKRFRSAVVVQRL